MQCMLDGGWGTGWGGGGEKHQENCFMAFNYITVKKLKLYEL